MYTCCLSGCVNSIICRHFIVLLCRLKQFRDACSLFVHESLQEKKKTNRSLFASSDADGGSVSVLITRWTAVHLLSSAELQKDRTPPETRDLVWCQARYTGECFHFLSGFLSEASEEPISFKGLHTRSFVSSAVEWRLWQPIGRVSSVRVRKCGVKAKKTSPVAYDISLDGWWTFINMMLFHSIYIVVW